MVQQVTYRNPTGGKPKTFNFNLSTLVEKNQSPIEIEIVLYDGSVPNTAYELNTYRIDSSHNSKNFLFHLPITPQVTSFRISSIALDPNKQPGKFRFNYVDINDYFFPKPNFDAQTAEFVKLATEFALIAGYAEVGKTYYSDSEKFEIDYKGIIMNDDGRTENPTPARIHTIDNYIECSQNLLIGKTVARIIAILMHEYSHNYKNKNQHNEEEADYNGAKIFEKLGWDEWEYVNAFDKTFDRAMKMIDMNQARHNPMAMANIAANKRRLKLVKNYFNKPF